MSTIDFDAFRGERRKEPHILKVGGKSFELPAELPASLAMDIARLEAERGSSADFRPEDILLLGADLFGSTDRFREILREGQIALDEMPELIKQVLQVYGGEEVLPNRAARRERARKSTSSKTGR